MTARAEIRRSTDGKNLVAVIFERESPDADAPVIEVIYNLRFPSDEKSKSLFADPVPVLQFISATRTDTRVPVELTPEEENFCGSRASEKATEMSVDN